MAIKVFFNDSSTPIDKINIVGLKQTAQSLSGNFKLGSTVCRTFEIDILKSAVSTQPSIITLKEGNMDDQTSDVPYAGNLVVDTIEDTNEVYYKYKVADKMINTNRVLGWEYDGKDPAWDALGDNPTADAVLGYICNALQLTKPTILVDGAALYGLTIPCALDSTITARDFIGYFAEINGGYAYISDDGASLCIARYLVDPLATIDARYCSSIKIGDMHCITRVVYDSVLHAEAGDPVTTTGDTVYVNTNNILFTDSGKDTIQAAVNNINAAIHGFTFYNIEVEKCPVRGDIRAGETIGFSITKGGITTVYNTIAQSDWSYNGGWLGGYKLEVQTSRQEETSIIDNTRKRLYKVGAEIDRASGEIVLMGQSINERIDDVESSVNNHEIYFRVRANQGDVIVTNESAASPTAYTSFKGDGMRIYVGNVLVAEATVNRFECDRGLGVQDWAIESPTGKPQTLNFYRKA